MRILCIALPIITLVGCRSPSAHTGTAPAPTFERRDDLKSLYDTLGLDGSFILHDLRSDHWVFVDSAQADSATLPASTYKILGSLIELESGTATDADLTLPWDSVKRRPEIDRALSLRDAYTYSAFWYHSEMARRMGAGALKHWLDTIGYGNADTSGGFDRCWVSGGLRITPRQQVQFLERLYRNELPLSARTVGIVKDIMVQADTLGYVLRGKTGWAQGDAWDLGWYVGWVERTDSAGPWFFANRVICRDTSNVHFAEARKALALTMLGRLGALPPRH
jgi:beta-lactamase class D